MQQITANCCQKIDINIINIKQRMYEWHKNCIRRSRGKRSSGHDLDQYINGYSDVTQCNLFLDI